MFPILFSVGPVVFKTLNLFYLVSFLAAGFVFWRKGREEHYEEDILFDGLMYALIVGGIISRIGFIIFNFSRFGFNVISWFDIFSMPGFDSLFGLIGGTLILIRHAKKQKWDVFEILDFWVLAISISTAIMWFGSFFDGTRFGNATQMPWGMVFPGVTDKHHPVQLYAGVLYAGVFWILSKLEYKYRTFEWYKSKRKSAQTGFLFCLFLILCGFSNLVLSLIMPAQFVFSGIVFDQVIALMIMVLGGGLLYVRSGRKILPDRSK